MPALSDFGRCLSLTWLQKIPNKEQQYLSWNAGLPCPHLQQKDTVWSSIGTTLFSHRGGIQD